MSTFFRILFLIGYVFGAIASIKHLVDHHETWFYSFTLVGCSMGILADLRDEIIKEIKKNK